MDAIAPGPTEDKSWFNMPAFCPLLDWLNMLPIVCPNAGA
jgi:hypothetical protein